MLQAAAGHGPPGQTDQKLRALRVTGGATVETLPPDRPQTVPLELQTLNWMMGAALMDETFGNFEVFYCSVYIQYISTCLVTVGALLSHATICSSTFGLQVVKG